RALLVPEYDGLAIVAEFEKVLREVESRADEPSRSALGIGRRDAVSTDEHALADGVIAAPFRDHAAEAPDFSPEELQIADGPVVQRLKIHDARRSLAEPLHARDECREVGAGDLIGRRRPHHSVGCAVIALHAAQTTRKSKG